MPSGARFNGVDFDDIFEPGTVVASASLIRQGGGPLQYAARGSVPKYQNVGLRVGGSDVSNLWLPKGSAPPPLPIPAVSAIAAAATGTTGAVIARAIVSIGNNGTYSARTEYVNATEGGQTVASGTWLPAGASVGDFEVQFIGTAAAPGVVTNEAPGFVSCATSRLFTLSVSVPAASSADAIASIPSFQINLRRIGAGTGITLTSLYVQATGYL